jgi:hypothetical protein
MQISPSRLSIGLLLVCVSLTGCATYSQNFQAIEKQLATQHPDVALKELDKQYKPSGPSAALYFLNKGMLLRMNQQYKASNAAFETARKLMEELEAVSVSEQAGAFTVNDTLRSYSGEDFEKILLHLYKAMNYLDLGERYEARVEALQVDVKLRELTKKKEDAIYTEEAFARYLSGIIFEELGEWSDALIAYRKAFEAYKQYQKKYAIRVPNDLKLALLRLTERQGLTDELTQYKKQFGINTWQSVEDLRNKGNLVFILSNGLVPIKRETAGHAVDPKSGQLIRIATPYYQQRPEVVSKVRVDIGDGKYYAEVVEDVSAIATKTLEAQLPGITARAIARAAIKYAAVKKAEKKDSALGLIMNVAGAISERADTRSWSTLPHDIYLDRTPLDPGTYNITIELIDQHGRTVNSKSFSNVKINKGKNAYLSYYWIAPSTLVR